MPILFSDVDELVSLYKRFSLVEEEGKAHQGGARRF